MITNELDKGTYDGAVRAPRSSNDESLCPVVGEWLGQGILEAHLHERGAPYGCRTGVLA